MTPKDQTPGAKITVDCPACGGSGFNPKTQATCKTCKGTGKISADI